MEPFSLMQITSKKVFLECTGEEKWSRQSLSGMKFVNFEVIKCTMRSCRSCFSALTPLERIPAEDKIGWPTKSWYMGFNKEARNMYMILILLNAHIVSNGQEVWLFAAPGLISSSFTVM